jgi:hypothetical protein
MAKADVVGVWAIVAWFQDYLTPTMSFHGKRRVKTFGLLSMYAIAKKKLHLIFSFSFSLFAMAGPLRGLPPCHRNHDDTEKGTGQCSIPNIFFFGPFRAVSEGNPVHGLLRFCSA